MSRQPDPELVDTENPEWTDAMLRESVRFDALPECLQAKLKGRTRGPQKAPRKESTTIRLSAEVMQAFRATGPGWQTRIDAVLRDWLKHHTSA